MKSRIVNDTLELEQQIIDSFKVIPFDFIFREPRIIALNPSIVQLRDDRPFDIVVLYDLFIVDLFKRKPVKNTRDYVYQERFRIVEAYKYYTEVPIIPCKASFDEPLGILVDRFICEFVDRMRRRNGVLINEERSKREKRLDMFVATYDDRDILSLSRDMLAEKYGMTAERIRQLLLGKENTIGVTLCRSIIEGSCECDDFTINPILQGKYYDLLLSNRSAFSAKSFDEEFGIPNDKTRKFLLDILDYSYCDSNVYFEPIIIKGDRITSLNRNSGPFIKYFSDNALYVSLEEEAAPFMQNKFPGDKDLVDLFIDIAKVSDRFETITDNNGVVKYGLKWQFLQTLASRVVRILYENGQPMSSTSVRDEYNRRIVGTSLEAEPDASKFSRKAHPLIDTIGKTGVIKLAEGERVIKTRNKGAQELIDSYMREHSGIASVDDVKKYLENTGYIYQVGTIKVYLSKVGRSVRGQENLYIHEDYLDRYPEYNTSYRVKNQASEIMPLVIRYLSEHNGKAKIRELCEMCYINTGNSIRDSSLRMMLDAYPNIVEYETTGKRGVNISLLLTDEEVQNVTPSLFEKKGLEYHAKIITAAKELLKDSKDGIVSVKDIFKATIQFVPNEIKSNIIYKLIRECDDFQSFTLGNKRFVRLVKK